MFDGLKTSLKISKSLLLLVLDEEEVFDEDFVDELLDDEVFEDECLEDDPEVEDDAVASGGSNAKRTS